MTEAEALKARAAGNEDPLEQELASFVKIIVRHVLDKNIESARKDGIGHGLMMAVVAPGGVTMFTNDAMNLPIQRSIFLLLR